MKTQISRNSFNSEKRYSGVYQQMGRMLTDADWNEFSDLAKNRLSEALSDIIGSGTPRHRGMVEITVNPDDSVSYSLRWGYAYVDGIQAKVEPDPDATLTDFTGLAFEYEHQADFPLAPPPVGDHILYLDVWERTILALEDGELLDAGLHGADTCTRTQTMAQVKWCETSFNPEDETQNPTLGEALLSLILRQGSTEPDPCDPCADEIALQDNVGNYLFRLEAHDVEYDGADEPQRVTLKWSSENAGEQYSIDNLPTGFASANWAYEFYHGASQKFASEKHLGKHLASGFTPERGELTKGYPDTLPVGFELVRRWDGFCTFEKSGSDWNLVSDSGFDRGADMSNASANDAHGHVNQGPTVELKLNSITATLELADWQVLAGDFWQADVRQALHVAGSEILPPSLPQGIEHHYLILGTVSGGVFEAYDAPECKRFDFPSLTDIQADDVCYDNDACNMPNVKTVQDALDHLCKERDLRFHNKHLHGWGIVCGLIAECCPLHTSPDDQTGNGTGDNTGDNTGDGTAEEDFDSRQSVCVTPGYALTCNGDDLVLNSKQIVDVMNQILALEEAGQTVLTNGNGSVCLRIDAGANGDPVISIEPYDAAKHKKSMFDGTLLMDFFQHCIMDLVNAVRNEFKFLNAEELETVEGGSTGLVSNQRRKFTSIINLLIQILNSDNGGYVFLSLKEHIILKDFYLQLRELLRSKTFCAMFEGDDFPDYPFPETNMTTIFGKNLHSRIKVHPDGKHIYSYSGADNTINVYDRELEELVAVLEMPAAEGAEVTAITFSPDGSLLYAAASVRGVDSVFGLARINDNHAWEEMTILCDITIMEMQVARDNEGLIYATGLGKGLYFLRPDIVFADTKPQPAPAYAFNAVGHMQIDSSQGMAYCTAQTSTSTSTTYNQIAVCDLSSSTDNQTPSLELNLGGPTGGNVFGEDGIALNIEDASSASRLYVVVDNGSSSKRLLTYALPLTNANASPLNFADIENTPVCLAYNPEIKQLILGFEDGYRLQLFEPDGRPSNFFRVPVQIQPTDLVVNQDNGEVYALNFISNTISVIPADELAVSDSFLQALANYRTAILLAFYALLGNIFQYLKDCFCHHLLVKCPSCKDENVIYLAVVEIRDSEVYKICNFDLRKYVKSFPTVDYWMSLIPIAPLIQTAISKICCAVIPNFLAKYTDKVVRSPNPPQQQAAQANFIKANDSRKTVQTVQRTDTKAILRNQSKSFKLFGELGAASAGNFITTNQSNQAGLRKQSLIKAPTNEAVAEFERNNIQVAAIEEYDASKANQYIADYSTTPQRIQAGSEVTLVQKDGKVMYYATKAPVSAANNASAGSIQTDTVRAEINSLQAEKATMEAELVQLRTEYNTLHNQRQSLASDLATLNTNLQNMDQMQRDLSLKVNSTRPISDLNNVDPQIEVALQAKGIRTVQELANADKAVLLADASIDQAKVDKAVGDAQSLLGLLR